MQLKVQLPQTSNLYAVTFELSSEKKKDQL